MTAAMALARLRPSVRVEPSELQPGEPGRIVVTLDIPDGCHVQSHTPKEPFLIPTTIHLDKVPVARFGPALYPPVEIERFDWTPVELEVHRGAVDIVIPVEIAPDAGTGEVTLTGHVRYQACTEAACFPPVEERIDARVRIQTSPKAEPVDEASPAVQMARSWDRVASAYDTGVPFFSVLGRQLVDRLDLRPGERVLDVATGRGACLFPAAERLGTTGWVVGTDVSSEMIAETATDLRDGDAPRATLLVADAQLLAFAAESFDVVMCSQAIGQLPDPAAAARELRRVLRPGGRIGIQRDVGADPRWAFTADAYEAVAHLRSTPAAPRGVIDLPGILADAGFTDIERHEDPLEVVFPNEQAWWGWTGTTGGGLRALDPLPEDARATYRDDVFERMQPLRTPSGFPMSFTIECVLARC